MPQFCLSFEALTSLLASTLNFSKLAAQIPIVQCFVFGCFKSFSKFGRFLIYFSYFIIRYSSVVICDGINYFLFIISNTGSILILCLVCKHKQQYDINVKALQWWLFNMKYTCPKTPSMFRKCDNIFLLCNVTHLRLGLGKLFMLGIHETWTFFPPNQKELFNIVLK